MYWNSKSAYCCINSGLTDEALQLLSKRNIASIKNRLKSKRIRFRLCGCEFAQRRALSGQFQKDQSPGICSSARRRRNNLEWLEETYPNPPLLPNSHFERQQVRALAAIIGSDIHPLNNRRILQNLRKKFDASEDVINDWCAQWISEGFDTIESIVSKDKNRKGFSFGCTPTIADIYLIPQIESARRFKVDLHRWPSILDIEESCLALDVFRQASPSLQIDA
jgi:hypothetical protein